MKMLRFARVMQFARFAAVAALASQAALASAGEIRTYAPQEFDRLAREGRPVVIEVTAPWCPTCKVQKPIVLGLMKQAPYRDVTLLSVDFDTDKDALRRFGVSSQSTLVAFRGATEVGRSVGDTSPAGIENLVRGTLR